MPTKTKVQEGDIYNRLTILKEDFSKKERHFLCKCECGKKKVIKMGNIRNGHTKSCGCLAKELGVKSLTTHGKSMLAENQVYHSAKGRCGKSKDYKHVLFLFKSFEEFYSELGDKPTSKHTLDRIDSNGHYEIGNCRWATVKEQMRNKKSNHMIEYNGETKCLSEWCEELNLKYDTVRARIVNLNWGIKKAFTT